MRWSLAIVLVTACGDNRHIAPAEPSDAITPACPVHGTRVVPRRVAYGCKAIGAPPFPDCLNGVVTLVTSPPDDARPFVVELAGRIRILDHGHVDSAAFLDISADNGGPVNGDYPTELGLLGLAFHPRYTTNQQFFVFYTMNNPDSADTIHPFLDVLVRYRASADPDRADPTSAVVVLAILDPFSNHNGGMIEFGPDGYLYLGTGDGGADTLVPDPFHNAQNPHALLGKVLRIDVDHRAPGKEYAIPVDNPFASGVAGAPEVWMLGLRNPWRWSFDRATGDLWLGDVGAATIEELDVLRAGQQAGKNLGWPMWEGNSCFQPPCDAAGMTFPLAEHTHADGWWAIIGGEVYRGSCYPDLVGQYFYADCGASNLWTARLLSDGSLTTELVPDAGLFCPTSLHGDARGELYETDLDGSVWQLVVEPTAQPPGQP